MITRKAYIYYNENGAPCGKVTRIDNEEGKKIFLARYEDEAWKTGWSPEFKAIYRLPELLAEREKPVLVVEGEKAADAGAELLGDRFVVITWQGGSNQASRADIRNLKNRIVYLLPDNDEPGLKAMRELGKRLVEVAREVYLVNIESWGVPESWDIADELPMDLDLLEQFIRDSKKFDRIAKKLKRREFPQLSEKGKILNTTSNIAHLLNEYKIGVRYNEMTHRAEITGLDDIGHDLNSCETEIGNMCVYNSVPKSDLPQHIHLLAVKNPYHPVRDWIESKPWDGISRISDLLSTIQSPKQDLSDKLIYRWLISCVAALYLPNGIASEGALVLQGPQKVGKTYWLLKLVPKQYRGIFVKEAVTLNVGVKDDIMEATNVWIAELGEIESTFKKSDVNELKNFITSSYDEYRAPFGRFSKTYPRRTIYYGSVNSYKFLADDTGNRRFWTVPVTYINYNHEIDMQQLWAEVKVLFNQGISYKLNKEEQDLLNDSNTDYEHIDPIEELLFTRYSWDDPIRRWTTATHIAKELDLPITKRNVNSISKTLRKIGVLEKRTKNARLLEVPVAKPLYG